MREGGPTGSATGTAKWSSHLNGYLSVTKMYSSTPHDQMSPFCVVGGNSQWPFKILQPLQQPQNLQVRNHGTGMEPGSGHHHSLKARRAPGRRTPAPVG